MARLDDDDPQIVVTDIAEDESPVKQRIEVEDLRPPIFEFKEDRVDLAFNTIDRVLDRLTGAAHKVGYLLLIALGVAVVVLSACDQLQGHVATRKSDSGGAVEADQPPPFM